MVGRMTVVLGQHLEEAAEEGQQVTSGQRRCERLALLVMEHDRLLEELSEAEALALAELRDCRSDRDRSRHCLL